MSRFGRVAFAGAAGRRGGAGRPARARRRDRVDQPTAISALCHSTTADGAELGHPSGGRDDSAGPPPSAHHPPLAPLPPAAGDGRRRLGRQVGDELGRQGGAGAHRQPPGPRPGSRARVGLDVGGEGMTRLVTRRRRAAGWPGPRLGGGEMLLEAGGAADRRCRSAPLPRGGTPTSFCPLHNVPEKKFNKIRTQKCFYHPHDARRQSACGMPSLRQRHKIFSLPTAANPGPAARTGDRRSTIGGSCRCQPLDPWSADLGSNLRTWVRIAVVAVRRVDKIFWSVPFTGARDASGVNGHSCPENEQLPVALHPTSPYLPPHTTAHSH